MNRHSAPSRPERTPAWGKRVAWLLVPLLVLVAGAYAWQHRGAEAAEGDYRTTTVDRGEIRVGISATGSLSAISTVDVGSQISGQLTEVLADYNDRVRKDQVIARIDPSTYEAQIAQGAAAVANARASLATAEAALRNAEADYTRKSELVGRQLVARSDADLARAARDQARAQVQAARAQIDQQIASTRTAQLNLDRAVIRSPVDGVVLTRSVEPGQTVAASLQAPVLFQIAEDLSKMEIVLAIDEADIGQVRAGQGVSFTVDAFPDRQFRGEVQQVRLSATNTNNVITYPVVVSVDNADQSLLPGMTANAEIEVNHREDVLRVANAALRFRPEEGEIAAPATRGGAGGGMQDELPRIAASLELDARQQAAFDAALERLAAQRASRQGAAPSAEGGGGRSVLFGGGPGGRPSTASGSGAMSGAMRQRIQERVAQQFADFTALLDDERKARWDAGIGALLGARRAPLYLLRDGEPTAVMVRVGASDGSFSEVSGPVAEGEVVITGRARSAP
ncbi:efflux RND transporter periplasmic adaptor subunit [Marilutibacter aestuarii]|uniref:Efflux RND transporter periplasmic adaptor subunit n=1 Tax=Marilutibacter aestuarii TaxID=1706195 RepID=A0A508AK94_9GAMM|nr:efflux RND transporter periplasmic adaptor subunit [Lysobacter aestuarii]TQD46122.1 efflux RND transporter periplasmic adaptor subunit [Lysobacter aestuarii]